MTKQNNGASPMTAPQQQEYIITEDYIVRLDEWLSERGITEFERFQIRTRLRLELHTRPRPAPSPDKLQLLTDEAVKAIKAQARDQTLDEVLSLLDDTSIFTTTTTFANMIRKLRDKEPVGKFAEML